ERNPEANGPTLEEDVRNILRDFNNTADISEVRVIEGTSLKIIGTSDRYKQGIVGQRSTDRMIWRVIAFSDDDGDHRTMIDRQSGNRIWILVDPIKVEDEVIGAIHLVANVENVYSQMRTINSIFASGTAISLAITAILVVLLARTITRPITDMRKQAIAMSKGNFSRKVKVYGYDEIGELAMTFNNLTKKLQEAQATTEGERRKLSSVLSYMTDGVIA
ncbi:HAMP domain-containing protein, partial [Bacillus cereus]|uniref:HAMP domain-containing protein n=4 Tax=Bacteria TaxID=2 RepID=UPI00366BC04B